MRSCSLNTSAVTWNVKFNSGCVISTSEFLFLGFSTLDNWDSQHFLITVSVVVKNAENHFVSLFTCSMSSVTFLPQEFSSSDKRSGVLEFPSYYISPLVQAKRQVSVRVDPFSVTWIHNGFWGGSDSNGFLQIGFSWLGNPGNFWSETGNVGFFLAEGGVCHKHGEVTVGNTVFLESWVEETLDVFPDEVGQRSQNVATWNFIVFNHFTLSNNLLVPLREIGFLSKFNTELMSIFLFSVFHLLGLSSFLWLFLLFSWSSLS